ncbi:EboA domain-containing protein [Streptomyces sp. NPDC051940]|uniref:EboA domain-containing protein n=1 Tax=Streptomyces sp. NPDC051940 TaxID=3155675 RepID=UPI0034243CF0
MTAEQTPAALRAAVEARLKPEARAWLAAALTEASTGHGGAAAGPGSTPAPGQGPPSQGAPVPDEMRESTAPGPGGARAAQAAGPAPTAGGAHVAPSAAPASWELRFTAARRACGAEAADAVRLLLLQAARADAATATRIYTRGDAAERRAVLHALPHLELGAEAVPLIEDALRTNDTRLVAAALGPYAAEHLDPHAWRQAVLKCLFTEVPVDEVASLADRARGDTELARMLTGYAAEREAAGRPVPEDLRRVLALTGPQSAD